MIDHSGGTRVETADYIQGLARELEALAAEADLGFLAYLLAMVVQEAQRLTNEQAVTSRGG